MNSNNSLNHTNKLVADVKESDEQAIALVELTQNYDKKENRCVKISSKIAFKRNRSSS